MSPSGTPISAADVAKVARLARLDIDEANVVHFTEQLAKVMGHFSDIDALDLSGVGPMTQPFPLVNVLREDEVKGSVARETGLKNATLRNDHFFMVPKVIKK